MIHPTAIVDPAAEIDPSVEIGPFVIIEGRVKIGAGTRIMARAHIFSGTTIGVNNTIHMGAIIGHEPQHLAYKGEDTGVIIGDNNVIREYVSIHRAYHAGANTVIGSNNFFMGFSHVGHDSIVGNKVIMANGSLLAGHTTIYDNANISGNAAIHQFVRIGRLAMIGGLTKVVKDIPPFMIADGSRGLIHGINAIGLRRAGYDAKTRDQVKQAYRHLYRSGEIVSAVVDHLDRDYKDCAPVQEIIEFIRGSARGISGGSGKDD